MDAETKNDILSAYGVAPGVLNLSAIGNCIGQADNDLLDFSLSPDDAEEKELTPEEKVSLGKSAAKAFIDEVLVDEGYVDDDYTVENFVEDFNIDLATVGTYAWDRFFEYLCETGGMEDYNDSDESEDSDE